MPPMNSTTNIACPMCGTPFQALPSRCPKCGEAFQAKEAARPPRVRVFGIRLAVSMALGLVAGGLWMAAFAMTNGIHPLDRWEVFWTHEIIGAIAGTLIGLIWGLTAAFLSPLLRDRGRSSSAHIEHS
jgi:hypothetical protein